MFLDSKNYKPKSIMTRMAAVKGYLRNLGLRFNTYDYKQMIQIPKLLLQREEPITKDLIAKLQKKSSLEVYQTMFFTEQKKPVMIVK